MDEKSNKTLAELAAAMAQSTSEIKRAGKMLSEQEEAGNMLDATLTNDAIDRIHKIVGDVSVVEALRLIAERSSIAEKWSMASLVYEVQVATIVGALVMLYVEHTQLTPDEFIDRVLPKLQDQLRTSYAVNYAEWQRKQQLHPRKDDDED